MAYVITDNCIKDLLCVDVCATDSIHPRQDEADFAGSTQMYIDPNECIECGACADVCSSNAIHLADELPPDKREFTERNALFYASR
jgi:NAD-dependent dihydropyrimidine dehydrogenase PreA subunit